MLRLRTRGVLRAIVVAVFSTILLFQNCAEVGFETPVDEDQFLEMGLEGNERTVLLRPTAQTDVPSVPIKVLLVVDNSISMEKSQDRLQMGLRSLLDPLRNLPVQVKIISTSGLRQTPDIEAQGWTYRVTGLGPNTKISDEWRTKFGMSTHEVFSHGYDVYYHLNTADLYDIDAEDAQFDAKLELIRQRVMQVSASAVGDDREQGLCNTLLALYDHGPNRFFHPGDKAAIVILSDENDFSRWHDSGTSEYRRDCRNRYTYGAIGDPLLPKVQRADYGLFTWDVRFEVAYDRLNDGKWLPRTAGDNGGLPVPVAEAALVQGLDRAGTAPCQAQHLTRALNYSKSILGKTAANHRIVKCEIRASGSALYGFGEVSENRCRDAFTEGGVTYASMDDYFARVRNRLLVPGGCSSSVNTSLQGRRFSSFDIDGAADPDIVTARSIPLKQHQASIQRALVKRAIDLFGVDGFFLSSIVHTSPQCLTEAAQSQGAGYVSLGQESAAKDVIKSHSICADSYAPALADVAKHLRTVIIGELILPRLEPDETIRSVVLLRAAERIELQLAADYIIDGVILRVLGDRLVAGDEIEVTIGR